MNISTIIAKEINISERQVDAAVALLDEDATVPFIARYRKEVTGGLDDSQLRILDERLKYLRELVDRKETVLASIEEQGKLTEALKKKIEKVLTKSELEDIYLPYKPKRRTKSQIAIEAGLEPLAMALLADSSLNLNLEALKYLNPDKNITDGNLALDGAKHILVDLFAEDPEVTQFCRNILWQNGILKSFVKESDKDESDKIKSEREKFRDYFEYEEQICTIPSHRALALFRGRHSNILKLQLELDEKNTIDCKDYIINKFNIAPSDKNSSTDSAYNWLISCVDWAFKIKLFIRLELDAYTKLREQSEQEAVKVFADNLQNLLMAAPAGSKVTMGLDPGYRTGVKVAVVDHTGKLLDHTAIFPHAPQKQWDKALATLAVLCKKHNVELISIGNGTASRETDKLAIELIRELHKQYPETNITKIVISEAGASVYSASELAAKEFPDLDVSYRGAVSIARRLQDPLAELVKIDPKSIGVGQYQHDVNQYLLARNLDNTVEDCVNQVGVDVNTASVSLLARISGLNSAIAQNIVNYRDSNGVFNNREELKNVSRMGEKTYQQCAGFLRITNGNNPLDSSSVHPEAYPLVLKILDHKQIDVKSIIGNDKVLSSLKADDYITDQFGLPTVKDIITELHKPGRDPRPEFKTAEFKDGVETLSDLIPGMKLEGVVTNVTPFGAFVDIGVHQDGLVHKSMLSDSYVENPSDIVKVGQIVKVEVLEVDINRKRISLTMSTKKAQNKASNFSKDRKSSSGGQFNSRDNFKSGDNKPASAMAEAFAKALSGQK